MEQILSEMSTENVFQPFLFTRSKGRKTDANLNHEESGSRMFEDAQLHRHKMEVRMKEKKEAEENEANAIEIRHDSNVAYFSKFEKPLVPRDLKKQK